MTKWAKNWWKLCKNRVVLYIFRICSLKITACCWKSRGARAPVPHSWRRQCTQRSKPVIVWDRQTDRQDGLGACRNGQTARGVHWWVKHVNRRHWFLLSSSSSAAASAAAVKALAVWTVCYDCLTAVTSRSVNIDLLQASKCIYVSYSWQTHMGSNASP